jgi:hypothetical protein
MSNEPFDESLLSAYLDGELTPDETRYVEDQLTNSPRLQQLLEEMRTLRHWVVEAVMHRSRIDHPLTDNRPKRENTVESLHEQVSPQESLVGRAPIQGPWLEPFSPSNTTIHSVSPTRVSRNVDDNHRKNSWGLRAKRGPWIAATALAASLLILFLANASRYSEPKIAREDKDNDAPTNGNYSNTAPPSATTGSADEKDLLNAVTIDSKTGNPQDPGHESKPASTSTIAAAAANADGSTLRYLGRNESELKEERLPDIALSMETTSPTNPSDRRQFGLQARGLEERLAESSPPSASPASPKSELPAPLQNDELHRKLSTQPIPSGRNDPGAVVELKQAIQTTSIQTPSEIDPSPKLLAWLEQSKVFDSSNDPQLETLGEYTPQTESAPSWLIVPYASNVETETEELVRQGNEVESFAVDANGVPSENRLSRHPSAYFFEYQSNRSNGFGTTSPVIDDAKKLSESDALLPQDSNEFALSAQPDTDAIPASVPYKPPAEGATLVFQFSEDQSEQALLALREIGVEWPGMDQAHEEVIYLTTTLSPTSLAGFTNRQLVLSRKTKTAARASASAGQQPSVPQEADLSIQPPATAQRDADQVATKKSSSELKTLGTSVESNLAKATAKQRRVILVIVPEPDAANATKP